jgi:Sulfotransferase domain
MSLFRKNTPKVFCLSTQRSGTTSVGMFFKKFGYPVADWPISFNNKWSYHWEQGDMETIFSSPDFKKNSVFEDDPWWLPEFYKVLYHRFPNAKFILFTRDSVAWFNSMISHSNGMVLGNTKRHCKIYRREIEFYDLLKSKSLSVYDEKKIDNLLPIEGHMEHYISLYKLRNQEIKDFFSDKPSDCFFTCTLEDPLKWQKLGAFMGINIPRGFEVHANKSN